MGMAELLDSKVTITMASSTVKAVSSPAAATASTVNATVSTVNELCSSIDSQQSSAVTSQMSTEASKSGVNSDFARLYTSALLPALLRISRDEPSAEQRWRAVKDAADVALAVAAPPRGNSNWRLALLDSILTNEQQQHSCRQRRRRRRRIFTQISRRRSSSSSDGFGFGPRRYMKALRRVLRSGTGRCGSTKGMRYRQQQVNIRRRLGGVVPGGRSMDVPLLLSETADYILSLQLQVDALRSLHAQLSSATSV